MEALYSVLWSLYKALWSLFLYLFFGGIIDLILKNSILLQFKDNSLVRSIIMSINTIWVKIGHILSRLMQFNCSLTSYEYYPLSFYHFRLFLANLHFYRLNKLFNQSLRASVCHVLCKAFLIKLFLCACQVVDPVLRQLEYGSEQNHKSFWIQIEERKKCIE